MPRGPLIAAWTLGALAAIGVAGSVYRIPIQVSDSLEVIERVVPLPSMSAAFSDGLTNSTTMLRPMKQVWAKLLVSTGETLNDRFHLAFRGFHAAAGAVLIALFVWACRVRAWPEVAALACGLVVLTGMHTFVGLFRESFPVNHYLLVAIAVLSTFALSQSKGGWLADVAAVAIFAAASLTFESGLLVWPVACAAYAAGSRGISKRGLAIMTALLAIYVVMRVGYLGKEPIAYGQRTTGFGAGVLTAAEQVDRFGGNPLPFWAYNVSMAATSVFVSQPTVGQWTVVRAWERGAVPPVYFVEIGSSLIMTALIAWYIAGRGASGRRRWREPLPLVFLALVAASAAMSYAYSKNEIVSAAGVMYALVGVAAVRELLVRARPGWRAVPIAMLLVVVSSAWAMRAAGLHLRLRHGAFEARAGWAYMLDPTRREYWPRDPRTLRVIARMREESILQPAIAPALLPRWTELWWGED